MRRLFFPESGAGLSLAEIMVGVAITGIVSVFAMNQFSDFTRRQWEAETKASAVAETELAAEVIQKNLPQFVHSVTGTNGETAPPSTFWTCNSMGCTMNISYNYTNNDGVAATDPATVTPMKAECVSIEDAKLSSDAVGLHERAVLPGNPRCLTCDTGKAPRLTVSTYTFDASSGAPIKGPKDLEFPKKVGSMARQGNLAMGVCVEVASYEERLGSVFQTASGPVVQDLNIPRFDRWRITLIPVYSRLAPSAQRSGSQIKSDLQSPVTEILISAPQRFAPGFKVTPIP